ncbi:hypothetical protein AWQ21_06805 [Picosynechococcus sp. PCC 7003]|nr:hypothetical protein AWQ21_06805 [Picosynechococcus sp. PCC 7003]
MSPSLIIFCGYAVYSVFPNRTWRVRLGYMFKALARLNVAKPTRSMTRHSTVLPMLFKFQLSIWTPSSGGALSAMLLLSAFVPNAGLQGHHLNLYGCINGLISASSVALLFVPVVTVAKNQSPLSDIVFAPFVERLIRKLSISA